MGMTRKITYGSVSNNQNGEVYSGAETWGELKSTEVVIGSLAVGMSAVARTESGSQIKITSDSQRLPEGDFTLYFLLEKNNSGGEVSPEVAQMVDKFITEVVEPHFANLSNLSTKEQEEQKETESIPF